VRGAGLDSCPLAAAVVESVPRGHDRCLFRATPRHENHATLATHERKQEMLSVLLEGLKAIGALPRHDGEAFVRDWTTLFSRLALTNRETQLLQHMARKMSGASGGEAQQRR